MDVALQIAKILGIACTTGLAVLGLLTDFRDDQKRVTKWGRRALAAILVSGSLTLLAHVLESVASSRAQQRELARLTEEVRRQEETLSGVSTALVQLQRDQQSLVGARVSLSMEFPEDSPYIASHHEWLRSLYASYSTAVAAGRHPYDPEHGDFSVFKSADGKAVESVLLFAPSKDFPDISFSIAVTVTEQEIDPSNKKVFSDYEPEADLSFALANHNPSNLEEMRLTYYPSRKTYALRFVQVPAGIRYASGRVTSLLDLPGRSIGFSIIDYIPDGGEALLGLSLTEVAFIHTLGTACRIPAVRIQTLGQDESLGYTFYAIFPNEEQSPSNE